MQPAGCGVAHPVDIVAERPAAILPAIDARTLASRPNQHLDGGRVGGVAVEPGWRARRLLRRAIERRWLDHAAHRSRRSATPDEAARDAGFGWLKHLLTVKRRGFYYRGRAPNSRSAALRSMAVINFGTTPTEGDARPGWERYELSLIGRGGRAVCFRSRPPPGAPSPSLLRHGEPELLVSCARRRRKQVEHPTLPRLRVGDASGQPYIAIQLIDGASLREGSGAVTEQAPGGSRIGLPSTRRAAASSTATSPKTSSWSAARTGVAPTWTLRSRPGWQPGTTLPALMGTAAYMSPEQACGDLQALDTAPTSRWARRCTLLHDAPPWATDVRC